MNTSDKLKEEVYETVMKAGFRVNEPDSSDFGRTLIHCFMGSFGADWDKDEVLKLIGKAEQIAWVKGQIFGHELGVRANGKNHYFDVKAP